MLYGSQQNCTEMLPCDRSHQLGEGQDTFAEMPYNKRPSRLVLGGYSLGAFMPDNYHPHQLGKGHGIIAEMPRNKRPSRSVRGGSSMRRSNANVPSPFPISFMEVDNSQQRCHPDTTSKGKGQPVYTGMSTPLHPSPPVHRGHQNNAAMSFLSRLVREGSVVRRRNAIRRTPFPTSLWANRSTQKCYTESAHQLGKDIICTLIKPLLFLPFLLIYGSLTRNAAMLEG